MTRLTAIVWIDAREAVIVRWQGAEAHLERIDSDVPAHHRATGHVRHDASVRPGGAAPKAAGEPHRLEHLTHFVGEVLDRLPDGDDLLILGPGVVRERLEHEVRERDRRRGCDRLVMCEASPPLTDRQLVALLRYRTGADAPRQTPGARRWSRPPSHRGPGQALVEPHRVVAKPPHRPERGTQ
ncbi:MAG: hypothetical protein ACXW4H_05925 [Candidatus Limnocylindrales bacterium]